MRGANKQNVDAKQLEIQNLRCEIKELKSLVAAVVSTPAKEVPVSQQAALPNPTTSDCSTDSEVAALKNS